MKKEFYSHIRDKEDWTKYVVNVAGIDFRPVSMGSLTLLYDVHSPLVVGGEVDALDFCVFAWIHAAPLMEVINSIKAETFAEKALEWGIEVPAAVFASYTLPTIKALAKDLSKVFIDKNSGFVPFPVPSPCKPSCWKRAWTSFKRLFLFG